MNYLIIDDFLKHFCPSVSRLIINRPFLRVIGDSLLQLEVDSAMESRSCAVSQLKKKLSISSVLMRNASNFFDPPKPQFSSSFLNHEPVDLRAFPVGMCPRYELTSLPTQFSFSSQQLDYRPFVSQRIFGFESELNFIEPNPAKSSAKEVNSK
jgi:hypothetical protein